MRPFEIDWWPNRIVCETGATRQLGTLAAQIGRSRAMVVCGKSISGGPLFQLVRERLGGAYAGAFTELQMHAPLPVLERGAAVARELNADLIVSLGGGSAIDSGKGIAMIDTADGDYLSYSLAAARTSGKDPRVLPPTRMAHIAIPTTSGSGSEVAPTCGLRDPAAGRKQTFRQNALIPCIALLDPEMTVLTPPKLAAASGMTAVARCIESLYSGRRNPLYAGLALQALRMLADGLPKAIANPKDLELQSQCQIACTMSAIAANVNISAVHAVGHVVGGRYGLQHGVSHAILLAPAMRLLLPGIGDLQRQVLDALGGDARSLSADDAGAAAAGRIEALVASLPLPGRLHDAGVVESDLPLLAEHASHDPVMAVAAIPVTADKILKLLQSVW